MKDPQLKKIDALYAAIVAVIDDPEIPINAVKIETNDGRTSDVTVVKPNRPLKKTYSDEELKERAAEHARLSNAIESYRIEALQENNQVLVTTTHLAALLKKTKYEVINHLKNLVRDGKLNYITKTFNIKEDDPEYKKLVKLIDFNELADVEKELPTESTLFDYLDKDNLVTAIKNRINGSEDMVAPIEA